MDGYIKLSFVGKNFITRTIKMDDKSEDKSISWNQSFNLPVQLPLLVETLQVQVWDKNESSEDTCLGSLHFKINNIIQKDIYKEAGWQNIFGSPINKPGDPTVLKMNEDPECATCWKGRLLMSINYKQTNEARCMVKDISQDFVDKAQAMLKMNKF